jgi:hypothetical protein
MKRLLLLVVALSACTGRESGLPVLDVAGAMNQTASSDFRLNDILEVEAIVPIETRPDVLIGDVQLVHIDRSHYYVVDHQIGAVVRIDREGRIVSTIARVGRGPGEYLGITGVDVDETSSTIRIFDDMDSDKYITYDMDGNFIAEGSLREKGVGSPLFISDDYMVTRGRPEGAFRLYITDRDMNIQRGLFPMDSAAYSSMERFSWIRQTSVGSGGDAALVNIPTNDTLYRVTKLGTTPELIIDRGAYRMDEEDMFLVMTPPSDPFDLPKLRSTSVSSAGDYYFVRHMVLGFIQEIWSKRDNRLVARTDSRYGFDQYGFRFAFPSGATTLISSLHVKGDTVAFVVDAIDAVGSIEGVQEDDNPVIIVAKLKTNS